MYKEPVARCLLSHPAHPPHHDLSFRYNRNLRFGCFTCGGKKSTRKSDYLQYYCTTCGVEFHNDCHQRPRRITHPYHLQHPLTLFYRDPETGDISNIMPDFDPSGSDHSNSVFVDTIVPSKSDIIFHKCTWCGNDFKGDWFYRCLICNFCLDIPCAITVPPLTIANPKGHHHSLLFLPRPLLVPCDGCGFVDPLEPSYACFQCNYMAHQSCIDLPRVIKITRHPHRLSYIPYRSPLSSSCRICYKDVDIKYGQYTCNYGDCSYVVHSKCATHVTVWDGTDLEWETEESVATEEDVAPFKRLGDGLIDHFCHQHFLELKKHDGGRDTEKKCEACIFPIVSPQFYHCEECNYSLHEECAGLPRKLDHALHNHNLILYPHFEGYLPCSACFRPSTGFFYGCFKEGCESFVADVRCISVQECFIHKSHSKHLIFISTFHDSKDEILCKGCKKKCSESYLQCTEREFALCYTCGTIPDEIHYRFDKHPLALCYGESADDDDDYMHWCEVCEKQLDPREWFYTCDQCCITVHVVCVFGSSYTMKPGSMFQPVGGNVKVVRNGSSSRLFCYECNLRCTGSIYYEGYWWNVEWSYDNCRTEATVFCSLECTEPGMRRPFSKDFQNGSTQLRRVL